MNDYLYSTLRRFESYKLLAEKTFEQLKDEELFWQYNEESNSVAIIVQHIAGNMLSRFTDFLNSDGEKPWRDRDTEFDIKLQNRQQLMAKWKEGWACLFDALNSLNDEDLQKTVYIRNEAHLVLDAINRQLTHYPYHIGQIVFIGKMLAGEKWQTLSVAKGQSGVFNKEKFGQPKN